MTEWKTLSKEPVFENGKFVKIENHKIELPDGKVINNWTWIITPDYVNVAATTNDGKYLCFRQTKYAVSGTSIAPVGGYIEPNEKPIDAAKRELLEETGYTANEWIDLGSFVADANRGCGNAYLFLAKGATKITDSIKDDLEEQELLFLNKHELESYLSQGEVKVLSWAFTFYKSLMIT
jgi:ADP-ribose pyrophosphatase